MEKAFWIFVGVVVTPMILFLLYVMFFIMPVALYTDAECLRNGYPKAEVTVGLERYCMNLDGSVTVKVEHMGKK